MVKPRFKIVVPSYNSAEWLSRCLGSIESQHYRNFDVCVVDDGSTDPRHTEIVHDYCQRNGWKSIINPINESTCASMVKGVAALECDDEDIVIQIDGDDWLYSEFSFGILADIYERQDPLMTFGQVVRYRAGTLGPNDQIPISWALFKLFRKKHFVFHHPRTFRYLLWRNIRDEDLRDDQGCYLKAAWDVAAYWAMLEMSGLRFLRISTVLMVYNDANPISDSRIHAEEVHRCHKIALRQKPYPTLDVAKASLRKGLFGRRPTLVY